MNRQAPSKETVQFWNLICVTDFEVFIICICETSWIITAGEILSVYSLPEFHTEIWQHSSMIPSLSNCSAILSLLLFHLTQPQRTQTTHFRADFNVPKQNLQLTILLSSLFNIKKRRVYADVREFAANQLFFYFSKWLEANENPTWWNKRIPIPTLECSDSGRKVERIFREKQTTRERKNKAGSKKKLEDQIHTSH